MGYSNFKKIENATFSIHVLCLRTVVPEAVDIHKNDKILLRQHRIAIATLRNIPIR